MSEERRQEIGALVNGIVPVREGKNSHEQNGFQTAFLTLKATDFYDYSGIQHLMVCTSTRTIEKRFKTF